MKPKAAPPDHSSALDARLTAIARRVDPRYWDHGDRLTVAIGPPAAGRGMVGRALVLVGATHTATFVAWPDAHAAPLVYVVVVPHARTPVDPHVLARVDAIIGADPAGSAWTHEQHDPPIANGEGWRREARMCAKRYVAVSA